MKRLFVLSVAAIFVLITSTIFAGETEKAKSTLTYEQIEDNLLAGLKTDNLGLNVSCAYMLGNMKSDRAVIPLMKMLRCEKDERAQLMAALSLMKIGDERGIFLIKRLAKFSDCERVKCMCERFTNVYLYEKYFKGKDSTDIYLAELDL